MAKAIDLEKYKKSYLEFMETRKGLILSMLDGEGKPFTSCAPFVKKDGKLYIYISQVAEHYYHMENSEWIDAMMIADESTTKNPFATERMRMRCTPKNIGNAGHDEIFELFNTQFDSKLLDVLRGLDFSLFELTPSMGRYVVGFGMAFDANISGDVFTHVVVDKKNKANV